MRYFPLFADLRDQSCLIVGGGDIALRKARLLIAAGARVSVVAPRLSPAMARLVAEAGWLNHRHGVFEPDMIAGHLLVIAATDLPEVNRAVFDASTRAGVFVNSVDDPGHSTFIVPAIVDRSPLVVAISSGGAAPVLARRIRQWLEAVMPEQLGELARLAGSLRQRVKDRLGSVRRRREFWERQLDGEFARLALSGRPEHAIRILDSALDNAAGRSRPSGRVSLVGAGPGDPGLLTLRAMQRLGEADVVLHDRLVSREVLALARRDADLVAVGKQTGGKGCRQESIQDTMVTLARRGLRVVRLKGGDPFVFGRGGEELAALRAAGIEWEVVPGITAAMGCAAATGLPLTYRDLSESVVFVTAHGKDQLAKLDWHLLAGTRQTVALYMGVARAAEVRSRLLHHGRSPQTPVAIVQNGTTPDQFVSVGTLDTLPEVLRENGIRSPALIYIGETAALIEPGMINGGRTEEEPVTEVWSPLAVAG